MPVISWRKFCRWLANYEIREIFLSRPAIWYLKIVPSFIPRLSNLLLYTSKSIIGVSLSESHINGTPVHELYLDPTCNKYNDLIG